MRCWQKHLTQLFCLVAVLAGVLGLAVRGGASSEWEKTVEAARKEGKVVVAIPASAKLRKEMEAKFGKRFPGIELEPIPGRGSKVVKRMGDELKAGIHYFDVYVGGSSSLFRGLVRPGYTDALGDYLILDEVKDPKHWWGGHIYVDNAGKYGYTFTAYMSKNFWYNTELVKSEELRSYDDLLNPKWKGKIGFYDPRRPGAGDSTWSYMWSIKGEDFLRKLVDQDLTIVGNQRALAEALAKGKVSLTIGLTYYSFRPFIEAGLPVKPLPTFEEGTYVSGGSGNLTVLKDPPHPNATKVFVNWFLSKEGQDVFSNAMGQPTRRLDVDTKEIEKTGYLAAKDFLSVEDYGKLENQSEEKLEKVRKPGNKLAKKMIK